MSVSINKPTLGGVTMPFPSRATIEPVEISAEQTTLGGKTRVDVMARKYKYTMKWDYLDNVYYNAIETVVNSLAAVTFVYEKWPQSSSGITVIPKLSGRELKLGTGNEFFYSSVTLECTEVDSRI